MAASPRETLLGKEMERERGRAGSLTYDSSIPSERGKGNVDRLREVFMASALAEPAQAQEAEEAKECL